VESATVASSAMTRTRFSVGTRVMRSRGMGHALWWWRRSWSGLRSNGAQGPLRVDRPTGRPYIGHAPRAPAF